MQQPAPTYDSIAKSLHWLSAIAIFLLLLGGPVFHFMAETEKATRAAAGHAGLGTLLLVLMSVRLYWRSRHPVAAPVMPRWQARLSRYAHRLLYVCAFLQPLFGLLMAMTSPYDVVAFGLFNYSELIGSHDSWYQIFHICHRANGALLALTLLLHIVAAIYHELVLRDKLLNRMLPQRKSERDR